MKHFRGALALAGSLGLAGLLGAQGTPVQRTTKLTVSEPTELSGTILQPGVYTLKVLDYRSGKQEVQVTDGNDRHVITTVMAERLRRNLDTDREREEQTEFTYTIANGHPAVSTWYYPGDEWGEQFKSGLATWKEEEVGTIRFTPIETVAENTPPSIPEESAEAPALPKELPQTASRLPLLGLAGFLALAGAAALGRVRSS